jgi:hypothetical protein
MIPFRVKFMLTCYLILLLLIIILFAMTALSMFTLLEAVVLIPITVFALFSCVYDLLEYREELFQLQTIIVKRLVRLGTRFRMWRNDRFD